MAILMPSACPSYAPNIMHKLPVPNSAAVVPSNMWEQFGLNVV